MNGFQIHNQIDLFSGQAVSKISFIDWNGNIQELPTRPDKTPEQVKQRYIISKSLELIRKLVTQREQAYKYAVRFNFDINQKYIHIEKLNKRLIALSTIDERNYKAFAIDIHERIISELEAIQPGNDSRFYARFKQNINNLRAFFKNEVKRF